MLCSLCASLALFVLCQAAAIDSFLQTVGLSPEAAATMFDATALMTLCDWCDVCLSAHIELVYPNVLCVCVCVCVCVVCVLLCVQFQPFLFLRVYDVRAFALVPVYRAGTRRLRLTCSSVAARASWRPPLPVLRPPLQVLRLP
jgi:hypothetical protein